jgi:teichuronic acid biosynthesis glycosyltransferase TuaC
MKIAIVTPMLPVPYDPTVGRFIYEKARSLSKIADVCVFFQTLRYPRLLTLRPRTYLPGSVGPGYSIPGLKVEAFDYPALPVISRAVNGLVSSWVLMPRVRAFKPDIILAYWVYPDGFAATRVARALGIPCVVGALGSDIHGRDRLNTMLTRYTIAKADALITVSEAMRRAAIHEYHAMPSRVHTIVNGFNSSVFAPADRMQARLRLGLNSDAQIVIFVGRFIAAKGLRELISAARQIASSNDRFRLALIGDGVMKAELLKLIETAGLGEKVHLPGGLAPTEVAQWINASDVLTLPSWSEGYPNVVVEAAACGRPVVATDVGGTREIVRAGNGILIPPKDVTALVAALELALNRKWNNEAIAASIRRSWDDVAAETLQVCSSVLASIDEKSKPTR